MAKLSNAGKLYLSEYNVLTEARTDLERYLDAVVDQVTQKLLVKKADFTSHQFSWNVWQNKSTKGRIDVEFKAKKRLSMFREGKADIAIIYKDIRHYSKLADPESIRISVWTPAMSKGVEQEILQQGLKMFDQNIYDEVFVKLNVEDSHDGAEKIIEHIIGKSEMIFSILSEVAR